MLYWRHLKQKVFFPLMNAFWKSSLGTRLSFHLLICKREEEEDLYFSSKLLERKLNKVERVSRWKKNDKIHLSAFPPNSPKKIPWKRKSTKNVWKMLWSCRKCFASHQIIGRMYLHQVSLYILKTVNTIQVSIVNRKVLTTHTKTACTPINQG